MSICKHWQSHRRLFSRQRTWHFAKRRTKRLLNSYRYKNSFKTKAADFGKLKDHPVAEEVFLSSANSEKNSLPEIKRTKIRGKTLKFFQPQVWHGASEGHEAARRPLERYIPSRSVYSWKIYIHGKVHIYTLERYIHPESLYPWKVYIEWRSQNWREPELEDRDS